MKKSIALIAILACLVTPLLARTGYSILLSGAYNYNLTTDIENGSSQAIGVQFSAKNGMKLYMQTEMGAFNLQDGDTHRSGNEVVNGVGLRIPLGKQSGLGLNALIGATQLTTRNAANNAADTIQTAPLADLGFYLERKVSDLTISLDAGVRLTNLSRRINSDAAFNNIKNKHAVKIAARVAYGF
ncbi:hypothetical protein DID75_02350 [Candidatus Marinamargulisbacteria bacterium SCGC AG-410-N11]|nr:hypothetical protein DID75_02350 [Candidatus Marinamargulisbacteria bacterium SCGC AG-410-N11]